MTGLITTRDSASNTPKVPNALQYARYRTQIWARILTNNVPKLYIWVDSVAEDATYQKWVDVASFTSTGDVRGPDTSTDSAIALYDGATGKLLKDSAVLLTALQAVSEKNQPSGYAGLTAGGVLDDALVAESNVTQHQAALSITESQISDFGTYQPTSQKGQSNGYASLDANAKVPTAQLPDAVIGGVQYQGTWNAATNTPLISSGAGTKGHYYVVSVGGASTVDGINSWNAGDWIVFNGTAWEKIDNTDAVNTVFGRTGNVIGQLNDYDASLIFNDSAVLGATVAEALDQLNSDLGSHTHDAADVTTGAFDNARISQASVTQHQGALSITESQVSDYNPAGAAMARVPGSTYSTIQHMQDIFHSTGVAAGGGITDDGDGTITVAAGSGLIRATDSDVAQILWTDWAAESGVNVVVVDQAMNYIYVEYNAGVPQVIATTVPRTDTNTNIFLGTVYRDGTTLHITERTKPQVGDHALRMIQRLKAIAPFARASGGILGETGTRNITVTAGVWWEGLTEFTTPAIDTSLADSFTAYYRDGVGGWTEVLAQSQINNLNYDDGSGTLAVLTNNRYGVHWVYLDVEGDVYVIYGQGDYALVDAEEADAPASLPPHFAQSHARIIGKIIIQKSAASFAAVQSAFATLLTASSATDHGGLNGLGDDDHQQYSIITSQAGAPSSTPARVGAINVDTTADVPYIATDNLGSGDWKKLSTSSSVETLTNKTISAGSNTITGLLHGTHVDDPSSGVHGVSGNIVGTTDAQALTNKTIDADFNTLSNIGAPEVKADIVDGQLEDATPATGDYVLGTSGGLLRKFNVGNMPVNAPIVDSTSLVKDVSDPTRQVRLDAAAVATGTVRVIFMGDRDVNLAAGGTFAELAHNHSAADINSGTFADARIAQSSVTQHQGAIDHGSIAGILDDDHTQYSIISSSAGAPASTPPRAGAIYVDTTAKTGYLATDTTGASDWKLLVTTEQVQTLTNKTLGAGTTVTNMTVNLGSDATGDIYYNGGSGALTRRAIGSDGQVLKVSGGIPSWGDAASPSSVTEDITQATHGFSVGDVVKFAGGVFAKAQADSLANSAVVGMVSAVAGANDFTVTYSGRVTGLTGLTANTLYYLDPSTAGALSATEPVTAGQISKPVFIATSTTAGILIQNRGTVLASAGSDPYQYAWIPASNFIPRTTNGAEAIPSELPTNDIMVDAYAFDSATEEGIGFWVNFGPRWNAGTLKFKFYWRVAASTTGNVKWDVAAQAYADDSILDQALGTEQSITDAYIADTDLHETAATPALTVADAAAGIPVYFQVTRDITVGSDIGIDVELIGVMIEYRQSASEPTGW